MATFLELVRDLARETGTLAGGSSLATVVGATSRAEKLVYWTAKAWRNIQLDRDDWLWMQAEFTSALVIGQKRYTSTNFGIASRFGYWHQDSFYLPYTIYDPAEGVDDETEIKQIEYEIWREKYDRQSHDNTRPIEWAISPAREFCVGPTPDKAFVIRGSYQKSPQTLAADADIPEMPVKYHDLIVWEAARLLSIHDEAQGPMISMTVEAQRMKDELTWEQLPEIQIGWSGGPIDQ